MLYFIPVFFTTVYMTTDYDCESNDTVKESHSHLLRTYMNIESGSGFVGG